MNQSTMYQFRIDAEEKARAFAVFERLGIKPAQAIRLFLRQVSVTQSIPFPVSAPNETTVAAREAARRGEVEHCATPEELFKALDTADEE